MILPLQLRHSPKTAAAAASGWFVPGDSVERWLEVLSSAQLADAKTRLFVVPRSIADRRAGGLLVVPEKAPAIPPAGLPCRRVAERLFVPIDATLQPPVSDADVRNLCPLPISFHHPTLGLSGFEEDSALHLADLIETPPERADNWNAARPGPSPLPDLAAIQFAEPPSLDDVFGDAKDDIGREPPKGLPRAPTEPKENPASKTGRAIRRLFAKGVQGAMRQLPRSRGRQNWAGAMMNWAGQQLRGVSDELERLRHKELHRLLNLLKNDPEAGLRHAIPLNQQPHRGIGPPGGTLGSNLPDFNLNQLGGGGPADFWNVPLDLQELLRQRYREIADREMRLGRHRRAAYIFAHLLGDFVSAANALKQGKHFREAALLYEEHLRDPLGAAQCFAKGGLLTEAIERYEKLGRWLEVAELHERLGNHAAAEQALRRVISERLAQDDVLGAAKLLDERLHATDEALAVLVQAWPASRQAASAVGVWFQLIARLGKHETALERLNLFRRDTVSASLIPALLGALQQPARDFPHETVRHHTGDLMRVLIARQLEQTAPTADEAGRLMEFLVRLTPEDRLIARDVNRHLLTYRERVTAAARTAPPPPSNSPGQRPEILRRFELPRQIQWLHLRSDWHYFYAIGVTPKRTTLIRGVWEGIMQSQSWNCPATAVKHSLVFAPSGERGGAVVLATPPHVRRGVAILLEHGAAMHWVGNSELIELERDLPSPMAAFVPGGPLVLISGHQMVLLDLDSRGVQHVNRVGIAGEQPIGVCATASPGQFAVLGTRGEMTVFRVPR